MKSKLIIKLILALFIIILILPISPSKALSSNTTIPCPTPAAGAYQGILVSPNDLLTAPTPDANNFSTFSGTNCIISNATIFSDYYFTSFDNALTTYFTKTNISKLSLVYTPPGSGSCNKQTFTLNNDQSCFQNSQGNYDRLYSVQNANIDIQGDPSSIFTVPTVFFIDGNLNIKHNIAARNGVLTFIVSGNINIDPSVTNIDAFMITFGSFCDSYVSNSCQSNGSDSKLVINGSVIYLNPSSTSPSFVRRISGTVSSSEQIIYDPSYIVNFANIFSQDQIIWSEIQ